MVPHDGSKVSGEFYFFLHCQRTKSYSKEAENLEVQEVKNIAPINFAANFFKRKT